MIFTMIFKSQCKFQTQILLYNHSLMLNGSYKCLIWHCMHDLENLSQGHIQKIKICTPGASWMMLGCDLENYLMTLTMTFSANIILQSLIMLNRPTNALYGILGITIYFLGDHPGHFPSHYPSHHPG